MLPQSGHVPKVWWFIVRHCQVSDQDTFCQASRQVREKAADSLQALLTSAAGHGRLPRYDIIGEVRACLVDVCGGCPGVGPFV